MSNEEDIITTEIDQELETSSKNPEYIMSSYSPISSNKILLSTINKGKILIVDDVPTNRFVLKKLLRDQDFEVVQANNGQEALDKIYINNKFYINYRIIFMDLEMPIMNGLQATKKINNLIIQGFIRKVPIIAITASGTEMKEKCIESGMSDFLIKPISRDLLQKLLRKYIL